MTFGKLFLIKTVILLQLCTNVWMYEEGPCDKDFPIAADLDVTKLYGHWFEYTRTARKTNEQQKCVQYHFEERTFKTGEFQHFYINVNSNSVYNETDKNIVDENKKGEGVTPLPGHKFEWKIVHTDYENFIIYYGCDRTSSKDIFWITTRQQHPMDSVIKYIESKLNSDGFCLDDMKTINQDNCKV